MGGSVALVFPLVCADKRNLHGGFLAFHDDVVDESAFQA